MEIVRDAKTPPTTGNRPAADMAIAETRLALLRVLPVLHGVKNLAGMTSEQYMHELSWRIGYTASRMDQLQERLNMLLPQTEQGRAPNA